ncbi:hypothetical protein HOT42_gp92 [Microbacterium phage Metamorphoo]|uniref:Uncharacterized protein n=1 Tax=Microbacterium phage Metamorphoo TaxID=2201437 RepID=A0A2Z4Q5Z5_9CAUD|nr:hypothetical protein HOT42_gp92 [Microbacterium phage Metamorphoo]AWY05441.1 hypothetical protein SEA_METAMORPHOO_91 [Microbacterium phage Metamorphoo]
MSDHPDAARIEQSNDISGIIMNAAKLWVNLDDRYAIADELWRLGYRLTRVEHVHAAPYSAQPTGQMDYEAIERMVRSMPATHRRRVFTSPWEPMPEGETVQADGVIYSQDGRL